jgi:hypothetical protein
MDVIANREAVVLSRHSWIAYAGPVLWVLASIALIILAQRNDLPPGAPLIGWVVGLGVIAVQIYRFLYLRTRVLYYDRAGVWVSGGLFPWQKGVHGVKWRDLDEAVFFQGFFSWLLRSYEIRIGHRFTKASEIRVKHMWYGQKAVEEINRVHMKMADTQTTAEIQPLRAPEA